MAIPKLKDKENVVVSYLRNIHNSEIPILKYNNENSLSCVVTLAYLSSRNKYKIERGKKAARALWTLFFIQKKKSAGHYY